MVGKESTEIKIGMETLERKKKHFKGMYIILYKWKIQKKKTHHHRHHLERGKLPF